MPISGWSIQYRARSLPAHSIAVSGQDLVMAVMPVPVLVPLSVGSALHWLLMKWGTTFHSCIHSKAPIASTMIVPPMETWFAIHHLTGVLQVHLVQVRRIPAERIPFLVLSPQMFPTIFPISWTMAALAQRSSPKARQTGCARFWSLSMVAA